MGSPAGGRGVSVAEAPLELAVQVNGSYDHVRSIATIAEANGFTAVALADHYLNASKEGDFSLPVYDSLAQAAALGRDISRLDIVMLVSPITFRHPAVYAKSMTTIDELSGGRFSLGLGTGWHDAEHEYFGIPYPPMRTRFEILEEALGYLDAYINEPMGGFEGKHYRLEGFDVQPPARKDMRLVVGGTGPVRTPALAGRYAGEFNLGLHAPDVVADRLASMRRAASESGRDPDAIRVSTSYRMIGGDTDAEIDEFLGEWGSARGQSVAEMRAYVGDRIPMLTWDQHIETLGGLAKLGFQRAYIKVVVKSESAFAHAAERLSPLL